MTVMYVFRHGEAVMPKSPMPDRERRLTAQGRSDVAKMAEQIFGEMAAKPRTLVHSPFVRARQTAELINDVVDGTLEVQDMLVPSGSPEQVIDFLLGEQRDLILVSHMPLVAELVFQLTSRRVPFTPGSCVKLNRPDPFRVQADLMWLRNPEPGFIG